MGTLENYLIEQGMQKGEALGMQKANSSFLVRLLERKFGVIPEQHLEQIRKASSDTLMSWVDKVLEANHIEIIFE